MMMAHFVRRQMLRAQRLLRYLQRQKDLQESLLITIFSTVELAFQILHLLTGHIRMRIISCLNTTGLMKMEMRFGQ